MIIDMNMRHIKLDSCESTQLYLKQLLQTNQASTNILVTTINQTKGIGRGQNNWDHLQNSLAFSFTYKSLDPILTPILAGAFLADWLQKKHDIPMRVKWPNDLFLNGKKVGGIIAHMLENDVVIIGIGLNWGMKLSNHPWAHIFENIKLSQDDFHQIPASIVLDFYKQQWNQSTVLKNWVSSCCHMNKKVQLNDERGSHIGIFNGISNQGMALITIDDKNEIFVNGHLSVLDKLF